MVLVARSISVWLSGVQHFIWAARNKSIHFHFQTENVGVYRLLWTSRETQLDNKNLWSVSPDGWAAVPSHGPATPRFRWWHFCLYMKIQKISLEFKPQNSALLMSNISIKIFEVWYLSYPWWWDYISNFQITE